MASFWDPPVVLEPAVTWRESVSSPHDREAWEVNQSRNPATSGAHLVRCVYCAPTRPDGSRIIKYMLDGSDVSMRLPRSAYGYSLDEILPPEVERAPWMKLTRHPLVWDGQTRPGSPLTGRYFNTVRLIPSENHDHDWRRSMESVGLHWLPEHDSRHQPPFDIAILIRLAIMGSPNQILSKPEMEELLISKFPWFKQHRYDNVDLTKKRGMKQPQTIVYNWPYYVGQELEAGPLHPWLSPHAFPNLQPGATTFWYIRAIDFKSGRRLSPPRAAEIHPPTPGPSSQGSSHGSPAPLNKFEDEVSQSVYTSATPPPATPAASLTDLEYLVFEGDVSEPENNPTPTPKKKDGKGKQSKKDDRRKQPKHALTLKERYPIKRKEQHPLLFHRLLERLRNIGMNVDEEHLETQRQRFVNAEGQEVDPTDEDNNADSTIGISAMNQTTQGSAGGLLPRLLSAPTPISSHSHSEPADLRRTQSSSAVRQRFRLPDLREAAFIKAIIKTVSRSLSSERSGDVIETTKEEPAKQPDRVRRPSRQNTLRMRK